MKRFLLGATLGAVAVGVAWWWDRWNRHWDDQEVT